MQTVMIGVIIPFLGTTLGAALVFFLKDKLHPLVEKSFLGFAAGVMIAASVWSLILPAMELTSHSLKWFPAAIGFLLGIFFLLALDQFVPHIHLNQEEPEGIHMQLKKTTMLILAVTMHNIPEGMAVGIVFAGMLAEGNAISLSAALSLSVGIAIQNFPEGAVISMPLHSYGMKKKRAFLFGTLSGIVEPIAAIITILLTSAIVYILPYLLSFAAGAMIYVVVEELIPQSQVGEHSNIGTIGVAIGFIIMMILDIALG